MFARYCAFGLLLLGASSQPTSPAEAVSAVEGTLRAYEEAWSHHDAAAAASFYYVPSVRVTAGGPVVRATQEDQQMFFETFLPALVKSGYDRSKWESLEVRLLDPNTAIASGLTIRYRTDGSVFARLAVTYALYKTADGWKIFLSATHAPGSELRFR
jgi:ketosteroid isomerase-like protein